MRRCFDTTQQKQLRTRHAVVLSPSAPTSSSALLLANPLPMALPDCGSITRCLLITRGLGLENSGCAISSSLHEDCSCWDALWRSGLKRHAVSRVSPRQRAERPARCIHQERREPDFWRWSCCGRASFSEERRTGAITRNARPAVAAA